MPKETSAGAIVFRAENGERRYLLLHYPSSARAKREYWDLPKGHIEQGESEEDTVRREVREETGIDDLQLFMGFRETIHYWFRSENQNISKTVVFFLGQTEKEEVAISEEHVGFCWLPREEALKKLTYQNAKRVLQKADDFLSAKGV